MTAWLAPPWRGPQRALIPAEIEANKLACEEPTSLTVDVLGTRGRPSRLAPRLGYWLGGGLGLGASRLRPPGDLLPRLQRTNEVGARASAGRRRRALVHS